MTHTQGVSQWEVQGLAKVWAHLLSDGVQDKVCLPEQPRLSTGRPE